MWTEIKDGFDLSECCMVGEITNEVEDRPISGNSPT
jgi:hypothetical protein